MRRRLVSLAALLVAAAPVAAQPQPAAPTLLTVRPAAAPTPALKYLLLPDLMDQSPGNAALLYYRAFSPEWWGTLQRQNDLEEKMDQGRRLPLKELADPKAHQELRWVLESKMLQEVDLAARREYCDWELTPRLSGALLLPDIQGFRRVANYLALRARLEMAEGHYDKAVYTLQTGFALARHLGEAPNLISSLVGMAITSIMLNQLETLVQQPDAPNFYWALTDLPRPLINMRKAFQGEKMWLYNDFPDLKHIETSTLSPQQLQVIRERMESYLGFDFLGSNADPGSKLKANLSLIFLALKAYPQAKRSLIAEGRTPEQVEALPVFQVVLIHAMRQYKRLQDDMYKWFNLPYWEARPGLLQAEQELKRAKASLEEGIPLGSILLPAVEKVMFAQVRTDRQIAALRCVEALRLYGAAHGGKLPEKLAAVTEVPMPLDPVTGKSFDYQVEGDKATLSAPPPPGEPALLANSFQYEVTFSR